MRLVGLLTLGTQTLKTTNQIDALAIPEKWDQGKGLNRPLLPYPGNSIGFPEGYSIVPVFSLLSNEGGRNQSNMRANMIRTTDANLDCAFVIFFYNYPLRN